MPADCVSERLVYVVQVAKDQACMCFLCLETTCGSANRNEGFQPSGDDGCWGESSRGSLVASTWHCRGRTLCVFPLICISSSANMNPLSRLVLDLSNPSTEAIIPCFSPSNVDFKASSHTRISPIMSGCQNGLCQNGVIQFSPYILIHRESDKLVSEQPLRHSIHHFIFCF